MIKRFFTIITCFVLIINMLMISTTALGEIPFWAGGYYNATIFYQNHLTNYQQEYENAIASWLSPSGSTSLIGRSFVENSVSSSYIMNCDFSSDEDLDDDNEFGVCGLYIPFSQLAFSCTCHVTTAFAIKMNDYRLAQSDGSYLVTSETIQGYIAHEFGHALGLDDHSINVVSIMRTNNNFNYFYMPQPYDISNANSSWSIHLP